MPKLIHGYQNYGPDTGKEELVYADETFSGCCGTLPLKTKARAQTLLSQPVRKICLGVGKLLEPMDDGKQLVDIVETKNGPVTVGIRYVW